MRLASLAGFGTSLRMAFWNRVVLGVSLLMSAPYLSAPLAAQEKLRFAVGPYQPTASDTRQAFEPFFKHIAEKLGRPYELTVTNDWAGISVALTNGQVDVAWLGPWGYVLANRKGGAQAIATVRYNGNPHYFAQILARTDIKTDKWPPDEKGMSLSLADVGSTSGWLIPTHDLRSRGIDPKTYFKYRDGASHAANVTAIAAKLVDYASSYNRNLDAIIEKGIIKRDDVKVVWTSPPLPNDPLVVRKGFDAGLAAKVQDIVLEISEQQALSVMPKNYTGWVKADHSSYKLIEDAGIDVGLIKPER